MLFLRMSFRALSIIIGIYFLFSIIINIRHDNLTSKQNRSILFPILEKSKKEYKKELPAKNEHDLGGLFCEKYGGPSNEKSQEMIYWSDIPSDSNYISPFYHEDEEEKFLTFEPDGGGWNNIRMAMETVVAMAHAMGRTLVLPPEKKLYLLGKQKHFKGHNQKAHFSFEDFFHLESIDKEHTGIKIIRMEEFLQRTGMQGKLLDKSTSKVVYPPNNRTDWNRLAHQELYEYLRSVSDLKKWKPGTCLAAFPKSKEPDGMKHLNEAISNILNESGGKPKPNPEDFIGKPTPVNASLEERLREILAGRTELCIYDEEMQKELVVHFMCNHKERTRLLTHFYTFLFFEDWRQDLWTKRFVRDHLRYLDELQCAAARVIDAIHERARGRDPVHNILGSYDSFHVRRGDFQYKRTRIEAEQIYLNSKDQLRENGTIFISTDESNQSFFSALKEHYDVCFLSDFNHLFENLNTNYYGMLDQLVASRGHVFFGTYHSTFTGYINRIRGYHAQKQKLDGYNIGAIMSYYFVPLLQKESMRNYMAIKKGFYNREFPIAWRDIDHDIENNEKLFMKHSHQMFAVT